MSDVTIGTASTGEVLRHNGTAFVDAQLSYNDLSNTPTIPSTSDNLTANRTGTNYTGATTDTITTHLSGIDTALGNVSGGGGSRPSVDEITASPHTIPNSTDLEDVFLCKQNASAVTLPTAIGNEGYKIQIKNMLSSAITVSAPSPSGNQQTIDNSNSITITSQFESLTFISDGADWFII